MKCVETGGRPLKMWTDGVEVEDAALKQLHNVASLPFIFKHVAAMPDIHWGMGATVGSVIATKGAIIPAAVGVDIGCGMIAVQTTLTASRLPDSLSALRTEIERLVPHGRTANGGKGDRGAWHDVPGMSIATWNAMQPTFARIEGKHPKIVGKHGHNAPNHLGTLGSGNHFIEVCLDENQNVWVMLHSGSRGIGNRIGSYFIGKAKEEMQRWYVDRYLPDQDLAYLVENTELFDDYVEAVGWAQDYAANNRELMLQQTLQAFVNVGLDYGLRQEHAVNCHHNYVARENHFGENVLVTRKGAVRARVGELGIIPGSMGTRSYIVRGLGNADSFHSCSHGAGRAMSRREARKRFTVDDHIKATTGVECRKDAEVVDETPGAYKDIDAVMAAQSDLVEIVHTLKQVVVVKG